MPRRSETRLPATPEPRRAPAPRPDRSVLTGRSGLLLAGLRSVKVGGGAVKSRASGMMRCGGGRGRGAGGAVQARMCPSGPGRPAPSSSCHSAVRRARGIAPGRNFPSQRKRHSPPGHRATPKSPAPVRVGPIPPPPWTRATWRDRLLPRMPGPHRTSRLSEVRHNLICKQGTGRP